REAARPGGRGQGRKGPARGEGPGVRHGDGSRRRRGEIPADPERRLKRGWAWGALLVGACAEPAHERRPVRIVGEAAAAIAAGHGYVYYTTGNAVRRVPTAGGDPATLPDAPDGSS